MAKIPSRQKMTNIILVIWLIVLTICYIVRVEPNIEWSSETYMGIFVAFIGIATALVIGYQVINAIDVKSDLRSMRKDVDNRLSKWEKDVADLESKHSGLESHVDTIHASVKEGITILDALRINGEGGNVGRDLDAFIKMHEALLYSLEYNSSNYDFILHKLLEFGSRICTQSFGPGFSITKEGCYYSCPNLPHFQEKLSDVVESEILEPIKNIEKQIREHKNFTCISYNYSDIMTRFYKRVQVASNRFFPANYSEFDDF